MAEKPHINIRTIVNDIRAGMTDHELMGKFGLSARGLPLGGTSAVRHKKRSFVSCHTLIHGRSLK
jgi:hypothetical protein